MEPTTSKPIPGTTHAQPNDRRCWSRSRTVVASLAVAMARATAVSPTSLPGLVAINFGDATSGDG